MKSFTSDSDLNLRDRYSNPAKTQDLMKLPGGASGKEPACQSTRHKRCRFDSWVRKIPWRRAWKTTPVVMPGESHGQRSLAGYSTWGCKNRTWVKGLSMEMKLRFLMSHHRKNSVRDKVIGKKWIYSDTERSTFHRQSMGHRREWMWPINLAWLVFIGWVIIYANEWEDYSNYLGERAEVSRIWATTHSLVF